MANILEVAEESQRWIQRCAVHPEPHLGMIAEGTGHSGEQPKRQRLIELNSVGVGDRHRDGSRVSRRPDLCDPRVQPYLFHGFSKILRAAARLALPVGQRPEGRDTGTVERTAIASMEIRSPRSGIAATIGAEWAGAGSPKCRPYPALTAAKSAASVNHSVVFTTSLMAKPAASSTALRFRNAGSVCASI